jgi:energy-converting hydrogenase Eha subunit B
VVRLAVVDRRLWPHIAARCKRCGQITVQPGDDRGADVAGGLMLGHVLASPECSGNVWLHSASRCGARMPGREADRFDTPESMG